MHNKTQKKNNEEELDSPAKDDLVPDKLERPDDPLAEAIRFLTPLQMLASNSLSTHLLAFEIYYRKGKGSSYLDAKIRYYAHDIVLNLHSDASYLTTHNAHSRAGGQFFLYSLPKDSCPTSTVPFSPTALFSNASPPTRPKQNLGRYF